MLSDGQIAELAQITPLVLVNRTLPGVSSVLMDSASGMDQIIGHLESLGHEEYAYLGGPARSWSHHRRLTGLNDRARVLGPFEPNFASA